MSNISTDALIFLIFISVGIVIGLLFDIFRISRKSFRTTDVITYIEDIIFWVLTGILIAYTIFKFNDGEIRGFIFFGIILGSIAYILLFSRIFVDISVKIVTIVKKIVLKVLIYPLKLIFLKIYGRIMQDSKKLRDLLSKTVVKFNKNRLKKKDFRP